MTTALSIPRSVIGLATLSLIALPGELVSQDDAALREERRNAKKERQELRSDRREEIRDAQRELREYARDLEREYRERLREMDVAFQLRRTDLDAERKSKLAEAQSEIQAKMTSLYMQPGGAQEERGQTVQEEIKKLKDKTFVIV